MRRKSMSLTRHLWLFHEGNPDAEALSSGSHLMQRGQNLIVFEDYTVSLLPNQEVIFSLSELNKLICQKTRNDKGIIMDFIKGHTIRKISQKYNGYRTSTGCVTNIINDFKYNASFVINY